MSFDEYTSILTSFRDAFGMEVERPGWTEVRHMPVEKVIDAIRRVKANQLSAKNPNPCKIVLDAMYAQNKRKKS